MPSLPAELSSSVVCFPPGLSLALYATPASALILYNPLDPLNEHVVSRITLLVNLSIRYSSINYIRALQSARMKRMFAVLQYSSGSKQQDIPD